MKSKRQKLIEECETLIRKLKVSTFGEKCQLCGKTGQLGLFHVLPKGAHPRLRLHEDNMILAGWFCCHFPFHHDFYKARDLIIPRLKALLGENYEETLLEIEKTAPKLDEIRIKELIEYYKGLL